MNSSITTLRASWRCWLFNWEQERPVFPAQRGGPPRHPTEARQYRSPCIATRNPRACRVPRIRFHVNTAGFSRQSLGQESYRTRARDGRRPHDRPRRGAVPRGRPDGLVLLGAHVGGAGLELGPGEPIEAAFQAMATEGRIRRVPDGHAQPVAGVTARRAVGGLRLVDRIALRPAVIRCGSRSTSRTGELQPDP
jgi:hypothetical protein